MVGSIIHVDVIKWKHFLRYWPFVRGIHRRPVNSPHTGQWCWCFFYMCTWINAWVNNGGVGDLRRHRVHYDVTVMLMNYWYGPTSPCLYYVGRCAGTKPSTVTMLFYNYVKLYYNQQTSWFTCYQLGPLVTSNYMYFIFVDFFPFVIVDA